MKSLNCLLLGLLMILHTTGCIKKKNECKSLPPVKTFIYYSSKTDTYGINPIKIKYGRIISTMCRYGGLTQAMVYSFLVTENQHFNHTAISSKNAIGLGQIKAITANDIVVIANRKGILFELDKYLIEKNIGSAKLNSLLTCITLGDSQPITELDLMNPELNLVLSCLFLRALSEETNSNISKMGIRYLHGYFAFNSGKSISDSMLHNSDYVIKLQNIYNTINKEV